MPGKTSLLATQKSVYNIVNATRILEEGRQRINMNGTNIWSFHDDVEGATTPGVRSNHRVMAADLLNRAADQPGMQTLTAKADYDEQALANKLVRRTSAALRVKNYNKNESSQHHLQTIFSQLADTADDEYDNLQVRLFDGMADGSTHYFVQLHVGNPLKPYTFMVDTGSSLSWLECRDGLNTNPKATSTGLPFNPTRSLSFQPLPCPSDLCFSIPSNRGCNNQGECTFATTYADMHLEVRGIIVQDTFSYAGDLFQPVIFGCVHEATGNDSPARGLLGLGARSYSFTSQADFQNIFFCMPRRLLNQARPPQEGVGSAAGRGVLGLGEMELPSNTVFTRLIDAGRLKAVYMVGLIGISIDNKQVAGFNIGSASSGASSSSSNSSYSNAESGVVLLDTGAALSYLSSKNYVVVRDAFRAAAKTRKLKEVRVQDGPETCYKFESIDRQGPTHLNTPSVELHFEGGASIVLPPDNALFPYNPRLGMHCLSFDISPLSNMGILGNWHLSSFLVSIDTHNNIVGFSPSYC